MDLRIALINPKMEGPYPPLGLGYIASYLRKYGSYGYDIRIFDGNSGTDTVRDIESFSPHIVGFTGHSPQIKEAVNLSRKIREWRRDVFQVIGGVHVSADPVNTMKRGFFDLAVIGEGEETFMKVVDSFASGAGKDALNDLKGTAHMEGERVAVNERAPQIEDLDTIPFPSRDLFDMGHYLSLSFGVRGLVRSAVTSITGSRGCPYSCSFCGVNIVFKKVRRFSMGYTVGEIKELSGRYGARALYFADDTFILDKRGVAGLCDSLIREGLNKKVGWTAQARANLIGWEDVELLRLMKAAGCIQLEYGFESGSDRVLGLLKQNKVSTDDNQRAIEVTKASGLRVLGTFIVGTPGEKEEDLEMTTSFIKRNLAKIDYFQAFICTPFPGAPVYKTCLEKGLVEEDYFDEIERREREEKAGNLPVFTDSVPHDLVRETLRQLDYMGLKKVRLRDKALWVLYHIIKGNKDVSHHDRLYIFKRLIFYFNSLLRRQGASSHP